MELEGEARNEGRWVDRVVGLNDVRADITMMRTPDGHSRVELAKFHTPPAVRAEPESAPANTLRLVRHHHPAGADRPRRLVARVTSVMRPPLVPGARLRLTFSSCSSRMAIAIRRRARARAGARTREGLRA
jgi:hypothetical protein